MDDDGELWCDMRFGDFLVGDIFYPVFQKFFIQTFEMNNSIFIVSGFLKGLDVILRILYMRLHIFEMSSRGLFYFKKKAAVEISCYYV